MTGTIVVIPAYQPAPQLPDMLRALTRSEHLGAVVVVDDGSGPEHDAVFHAAAEIPGVELLRHPVNRGKGAALRTAFAHVLDQHPEALGLVTADADGQHTVRDVERVAHELRSGISGPGPGPAGARVLVLGERDFDQPDIPWRSRFGNKMTTRVLGLLFGSALPDTQTGLRGLSRALLPELLEVGGDRFDYEMRMLIHLLAARVRIVRVPIETVYEGGENRTSHFRPIRDSVVIYAAILRQLAAFAASSGLGFLVDIGVFVLVIDLVYDGHPSIRAVGAATLVARLTSVLVNYGVNHLVVFRSGTRVYRSIWRYAVLAVALYLASWWLTAGLANLLGHRVVWAKIIVDSVLFVASYQVQRRWVFRRPDRGL